jgi:hypothetical protein
MALAAPSSAKFSWQRCLAVKLQLTNFQFSILNLRNARLDGHPTIRVLLAPGLPSRLFLTMLDPWRLSR